MGMVGSMRSRWLTLSEKAASEIDLTSDRSGTITSITKVVRLFLQSAMLALGAYLAIGGEITPGVMIAASIIMSRALAPVEQSISHWRNFTRLPALPSAFAEGIDQSSGPDSADEPACAQRPY